MRRQNKSGLDIVEDRIHYVEERIGDFTQVATRDKGQRRSRRGSKATERPWIGLTAAHIPWADPQHSPEYSSVQDNSFLPFSPGAGGGLSG